MLEPRRVSLLAYVVAVAIPVSLTFNIDTTPVNVYIGEQKDFFGYKVLQFISGTNKGILVTAPLRLNGSGGVCKPDANQPMQCFTPEDLPLTDTTAAPVKHFGLSIAEDAKRSRFIVCSPSVVHECNENSYVNGVCYAVTDRLQQTASFRTAFQECTKKTVDLVFLFDGSRSMSEGEFNKNKEFIKDIMNSLKNSSIKFAAVQFSTEYRKVFDFNDYEAGRDSVKLHEESQLRSLTNTHKALAFVLDEILENSKAGASSDATKVVVLITDGDPSDSDRSGIIKKYDEKNIIRFVIGVKDAKLEKFRAIASEPKDKNAFKIENYDRLKEVLVNFQKKIFKMEGSKVSRAGDMTNEMSQSGFSAVFYNDTLVLGSVGSNSWRGSLQIRHEQKDTQLEDPLMQMDSYMGYSISVGEKNSAALYFSGAPRFEHTGQVVLFRHNGKNWTAAQRINGHQIGSYFGAELCSVDVNSDGDTDFLLVGAPLFYQPHEKREGQIYIYSLTDEMQLQRELTVAAPSMGRFGATISSLADLNGDGLRDVAVGAPLENDNTGTVYIYLGDRHRGIRSAFSQRITGQTMKPVLRFFGQAIDGHVDLGDDGLPDLVVGSQGAAVVLRSRPVFDVIARLSFTPSQISTDRIDCVGNSDEALPMVTLTICFEMVETTKSKAEAMSSGLNISYTLSVDPMRPTYRGFFSHTDKKSRNLTSTYELRDQETCFNSSVYMPKCVKDTLSPVSIKLNFFQVAGEAASGVLSVDSRALAVAEVPFEKHCRKNDTCIAELDVEFNFTTPTLLVAEENYFKVFVKLSNHGDDSYNSSLTMHFPRGLSFSRMTFIQATRPTIHSCYDLEGELDKTTCGISRPVFRSRSSATFMTSFHIMKEYEWDDTITVNITAESDNTNSSSVAFLSQSIRVQFEIKMAVMVKEDSIDYLNFTTQDAGPKRIVAPYKIENLGFKDFPVNVSLVFPTKLEQNFEMTNPLVVVGQNKTHCTAIADTTSEYCSPERFCKIITCDGFILERESPTEFTLSGDVQFRDLNQHAANIAFLKRYTGDGGEVKFRSFIHVDYDERRYVLDSHKQEKTDRDPTMKWTDVRVEFIILPDQRLIISTGVGLGLLFLIIITVVMFKLGCFKRKTLEYYQEHEDDGAAPQTTPAPAAGPLGQSEANGKHVAPREEVTLLGGGEANGGAPPAEAD